MGCITVHALKVTMRPREGCWHVAKFSVAQQGSSSSHNGHHRVGCILNGPPNSDPESIRTVEWFRGSGVRWIYPDRAQILALVKISKLLFDGVFRVPSVTCLNHHSNQHGGMTTYTDATGQTNHLVLGTVSHLKAQNSAKALEFLDEIGQHNGCKCSEKDLRHPQQFAKPLNNIISRFWFKWQHTKL